MIDSQITWFPSNQKLYWKGRKSTNKKKHIKQTFYIRTGAPNDKKKKLSFQKTIWDLEIRIISCKISCLPASPRIFERQKSGIITHF